MMITFKPKLVVNDKIAKIVNAPLLLIFLMPLNKFRVARLTAILQINHRQMAVFFA